jgi:hypothetical protein
MQVISYCEELRREWQLSVPPDTAPSTLTVAPLLTRYSPYESRSAPLAMGAVTRLK